MAAARIGVLLALALVAGCAARSDATAPSTPAVAPAPAASPVPASSPAPAADPADLLACTSDSDCAIKDVGSCCGTRPACVRHDAKTFPDEVKARCAREGRMGVCGFTAIEGCQCASGRCAPIVASPAPAAPQPLP